MGSDQEWSDAVKRAMERTRRMIAIHRGEINVAEYTQEEFDLLLGSALRRAEPDDDSDYQRWLATNPQTS